MRTNFETRTSALLDTRGTTPNMQDVASSYALKAGRLIRSVRPVRERVADFKSLSKQVETMKELAISELLTGTGTLKPRSLTRIAKAMVQLQAKILNEQIKLAALIQAGVA